MWTRFLPHIVRIRELAGRRRARRGRHVIADHGQWFAFDPAHRLFAPELGGGALLDLGIYPVSFASMVLGAPTTVIDAASTPPSPASTARRPPSCSTATASRRWSPARLWAATPCRAAISGELASIDVDPVFYAPTSFTLRRRGAEPERFEPEPTLQGPGKGLRYQAAEVVRCVREGLTESPALPPDETVSIMETLDAIRANAPAPAAGR